MYTDLERTMAEVSRFRELARSGPVTAQTIKDGVELHRAAGAEFDALAAEDPPLATAAESIRPGLELHFYCDVSALISAVQRLAIPDKTTKKLLQETFPIYALQGIPAFIEASGARLGLRFSYDFAAEIETARAMRDYLDCLILMMLLEALYRNRLMPIKEHLLERVMLRIGLDATQRAMDHLQNIKG
jgi:hypothetical protein